MADDEYILNIGSLSSISSSTISWRPITADHIDSSSLRERIKRELIEDLKKDGLIISKSPMKEMTEERMNRKIDQILENSNEKGESE